MNSALAFLSLVLAAGPIPAQSGIQIQTQPAVQVPAQSAPKVADATTQKATHRVEKLGERSYAIFGQGGNIGLFVGEHEAVLVDTQFARLVPGLFEAIAGITKKPIKFLINTHHHGDHVGGNPLLASKVQGIIAHRNVRDRMEAQQADLDVSLRGGLPTLLLGEKDPAKPARMDIRLPGLELHVAHRSAAHTDGDLLVGCPADHAIHLGDLMFLGILPFIDAKGGGGQFEGLVETITWLASWVPEDAKLIPGHGPVCGKKELARYAAFLSALQAHAKASPSKTSQALADSFDKAAWPEWKPTPTFVTWETLFDAVTGRGPGRV